ncbi:hypothetical protein BFP97_03740 [Roseivirga sp. 4D4]|uniref:gliding motility-associated C-terminal domain-containing protein n=1 Tax=Roseivirga sp. 4D4 TaxID=1889784 RepID=UPI000852FAA6|nr:gliding motility-associated C-terminal domain-containing protein [Roseivirga sp. 4D4]OEK00671.1 hypothetical protein BFP97_03740 [Roseivirga sp. 4D4]
MLRQVLKVLFLLFTISTSLPAQIYNNSVFIKHDANLRGNANRLQQSVLNKNNNLVSVINNTLNTVTAKVVDSNREIEIPTNNYMVMESNGDGKVVWSTSIEFINNEPTALSSSAAVSLKIGYTNDHYYIPITFQGDHDLILNGSRAINLNSRMNTLGVIELDSLGQLTRFMRGDFDVRTSRDFKVKGDYMYQLYTKIESNINQANAECPELIYYLRKTSLIDGTFRQIDFNGKGFDADGDDFCSNSGDNESFGVFQVDIDDEGNVLLGGSLRGSYRSTLSRNILAGNDEHRSFIAKLNSGLITEWVRQINTLRGENRTTSGPFETKRVMALKSGELLFISSNNNPNYQFDLNGSSINTSGFKKFFPGLTNSITKIDPDGNFQWVTFLDRPVQDIQEIQDSEDLMVVFSTFGSLSPTGPRAEVYYYNSTGREHTLVNPKYPNNENHAGYIRIDNEGNYLNHKSWSKISVQPRSMYVHFYPVNMPCNEFYMIGFPFGQVDMSLDSNVQIIEGESGSDTFIAKYAPLPPEINVTPPNEEQCIESVYMLPFTVTDALPGEIELEVSSSDENILPNDSLTILLDSPENFIKVSSGNSHGSFEIILRATNECDKTSEVRIPWVIKEPVSAPSILNVERSYNLCEEESVVLTASIDDPLWSNGETTKSITVAETGLYWVSAIDPFGCKSANSDTVDVFIFKTSVKPIIEASGPTVLCEGEELTLTTNLDRNIVWSTGESTQSITVTESGTYSVYQSSVRCGDGVLSDPVQVVFNSLPEKPEIIIEDTNLAAVGADSVAICEGASINLTGPLGQNMIWSNGSTDRSIEVTTSGKYWLHVERNGCLSPASDTLEIVIDRDFDMQIATEATICTGTEELELSPALSESDVDLSWSNGSNTETLLVTERGDYWLEASRGACRKERVYIRVDHLCIPRLFIPNVFSPNGDGSHDTFEIKVLHTTFFEISIFNQWGGMVFNSKAPDEQWDGLYQNQQAPAGKYAYHITYGGADVNGKTQLFKRKGTLTLMR